MCIYEFRFPSSVDLAFDKILQLVFVFLPWVLISQPCIDCFNWSHAKACLSLVTYELAPICKYVYTYVTDAFSQRFLRFF